MLRHWLTGFGLLLAVVAGGGAARAQCVMDWADGFAAPGTAGGDVLAMTVFDDGSGPALYVGGDFETVGDTIAQRIARWDGTSWSAVGEGLGGNPYALTVFDDGSGPALYAGCDSGGVRKWDGSSWTYVGLGSHIHALAVYDDGSGPALYAGYEKWSAGGGIVKWDGAEWSEVGGGLYSPDFSIGVFSLVVFDDGSGPALYVGGNFIKAGGMNGITAYGIARWDGQDWSSVGGGVNNRVRAMTVHDDGGGPALYAGGEFTYSGGVQANCVAKWDGMSWSALGTGVEGPGSQEVSALGVFDDGGGPALYVGGDFELAGGLSVNHLARWDGSSWSALGTGVDGDDAQVVRALAAYDGGSGSALYVGGSFFIADGVVAHNVARWGGTEFSALAAGNGIGGEVYALEVFDDGTGPALYAGGRFVTAGDIVAGGIARWDGSAWSPLGLGTSGYVYDLAVYDDGSGPALYAGGFFFEAGGLEVCSVARWDGASWSSLGGCAMEYYVDALAVFDDGSGPALYAAGDFHKYADPSIWNIAKWDGVSWSALGSGVDDRVYDLAVFDDGSGPALYAGGEFALAGDVWALRIAKWDGSTWSALSWGMDGPVYALTSYDDGSGSALYASGNFHNAGGVEAVTIARWDGSAWSAVGSGVGAMWDFAVFDDGSGPALYAEDGPLVRWDGTNWSCVGDRLGGLAYALRRFDDAQGSALYGGGTFDRIGDRVSVAFGRWGCVPGLFLADVNCDGVADGLDIDPFVLALVEPDAYDQAYPGCDLRTADCNRDGQVNLFDIDPFVALLTG